MLKKGGNKRNGFTLIELLVVLAVLAILATVTVVGYTVFVKKANKSSAETTVASLKTLFISADLSDDDIKIDSSGMTISYSGTASAETTAAKFKNKIDELEAGLTGEDGKALYIKVDSSNLNVIIDVIYQCEDVYGVWNCGTGEISSVETEPTGCVEVDLS